MGLRTQRVTCQGAVTTWNIERWYHLKPITRGHYYTVAVPQIWRWTEDILIKKMRAIQLEFSTTSVSHTHQTWAPPLPGALIAEHPFHLHFYSEHSVTWRQALDSGDWEATSASARRNQKPLNDRKLSLHRSLKLAVRETVADAFCVVQAVSFLCICLHHTPPLRLSFSFLTCHSPLLHSCLN